MKIIEGIHNYIGQGRPVYVAMGAFDGIHYGHARLIGMAVEAAHKNNGESVVLTFKPHPRCFISSNNRFELITSYFDKQRIISEMGVDTMIIIEFNEIIAAMLPFDFIEKFLINNLKVSEVFVGFNFYFGSNRSGNCKTLNEAGTRYSFKVNVLSPIQIGNFVVSSSKIRLLIEAGAVNDVIKFMGRPFKLSGKVIHGDGLGRKLNIPTANLQTPDDGLIVPKPGVYAVKCIIKGVSYKAVMNIGTRPTIYEKQSSITTFEVHILNFNADIYMEILDIYFIKRLRDEKKFADFKMLCDQIKSDVLFAAEYFDELDENEFKKI